MLGGDGQAGLGTSLRVDGRGTRVAAMTVTPGSLPAATKGKAYRETLKASGGRGKPSFAAFGLPPGLALSAGGVLSGKAAASGRYAVTVLVRTSRAFDVGARAYTLTVKR